MFGVDSGVVTVAHELKAPLSLVRQLALSLEFENDKEGVRRISEKMVSTSERALRQINDLLKVTRLEEGLFEMEPVNPRAVCDDVVGELWQLFRFNKKEVKICYLNKEKLVVSNRELLYSVVYNFCLNAMNYGGMTSPSEVFVRGVRNGSLRIGVRDYGPSIPTKVWRAIKDGDADKPLSISMRPGSSGLGLYIAARFIDYMSGDFGLIRHRDGTSFYVDLPISGQTSWL